MQTPLDVDALFDTPAAVQRIPRDPFEAALFRALIVATVERWAQETYHASVGRAPGDDGTWPLRLAERRAERGDDAPIAVGVLDQAGWPRTAVGTIWVGERDGRPVVCWAVAGQANTEAAPVAPWGARA